MTYQGFTVLLIEKDPLSLLELRDLFSYDFIIRQSKTTAMDAFRRFKSHINLVVVDDLVGGALDIVDTIHRDVPNCPIFMMSACSATKLDAASKGVTGFVPEPFDVDCYKGVLDRFYLESGQGG